GRVDHLHRHPDDGGDAGDRLTYSQPRLRKKPTIPTRSATITPRMIQKSVRSPSPGTRTFIPQMLAIRGRGRTMTVIEVRTRRMSLRRCVITDSFVSSRATITSL